MLADTGPLYAVVNPRDSRFGRAGEDVARLNSERLSVVVSYPILCLSVFDAVTAVLGKRLGLPVWSYDQHFDIMGIEVWGDG